MILLNHVLRRGFGPSAEAHGKAASRANRGRGMKKLLIIAAVRMTLSPARAEPETTRCDRNSDGVAEKFVGQKKRVFRPWPGQR